MMVHASALGQRSAALALPARKLVGVGKVRKTGERLYNLKRAVETINKTLFRFTTINQIRPNTIFNPIWLRAGEKEKYPLIGL
jgi:hypothetical protein